MANVLSAKEKGVLMSRFRAIGVPSIIRLPFASLVFRWVECSGVEWTVDRLKQVKVDFLRKKAGLPPASAWIRRGRSSSKFFGGVLGSLEAYADRGQYQFERVLALLNVYTAFIAPRVTMRQARKFFSGVTAQAVTLPPDLIDVMKLGMRLAGLNPYKGKLHKARPLLDFVASPSKRAPLPQGSVPEVEGIVDSIRYLGINSSGIRLYHDFLELFDPVLRGLEPERDVVQLPYTAMGMRSQPEPKDTGDLFVGRIGLIQEPGFKLRAVANPGRVFQRVMEPLGGYLFKLIGTLPWDCTYQQSKADAVLVRELGKKRKIFSVDLSGATDYFPLDLQAVVLKELLPDATDVDLFLRLSRGRWVLPKAIPQTIRSSLRLSTDVKWTKGQPLGLYPSFASFALAHGVLLQGLLGREWNEDFFVLGDDVVILDESLYLKYRETLSRLECPVAENKTLASDRVAEFRSMVYTKERVIPQFKWRKMSDESFLDLLKLMPYLSAVLAPKQRTVVKAISALPVELGGLGWNPKGLSLDERLQPFMPVLVGDYVARDRVTGYTQAIRELLYRSSLVQSATALVAVSRQDLVPALDQRARSLVSKHLGEHLLPLTDRLGRNLDLVLNGNVDLPIPGFQVKRVTKLNSWFSILFDLGLLPPKAQSKG